MRTGVYRYPGQNDLQTKQRYILASYAPYIRLKIKCFSLNAQINLLPATSEGQFVAGRFNFTLPATFHALFVAGVPNYFLPLG